MVGGPDILSWRLRQAALLKIPVLLAAVLAASWFLILRGGGVGRQRLLACATGVCLGWGLALHLADDLQASHALRRFKLGRTTALARVLPDHSAFVAYFGHKDAAVPLLFDRDIVILDANGDEGEDAPVLIRDLLGRGRRVFVLQNGFPADVLDRVTADFEHSAVQGTSLRLLELREGASQPVRIH
jgi:hypothetical protein